MITKELLLESAKKKGLQNKEYIEKDYFQDLFLYHLFRKTNLLVFKGGTALYKLYNLQRFSEDLDFSLLENLDVESMIKEIIKNFENAEIKDIKKTEYSILVKIGFKGLLTKYNTLRIDINLKNPFLEKFDIKNYTSQYVDINPFYVRIMSLKEIIAEKIHSLLARDKARDLYDLFFLLKLADFEPELVEKKLKIFKMSLNYKEIERKIEKIETIWVKELKPFVLGELPEFDSVKAFVLSRIINK
ncbi:nucleotidyl transferase AbiEii/AbiGii toxin family protein [Candidatus Pacearchaeota archaeon]|nr:nucleotidyl transferase AbiEii/AbiGii toxin family protein [Candidatus Pacearchaeota archaeon]